MSETIRDIFRVYEKAEPHLAKRNIQIQKEKINHLIANLYSPGPSFQYILHIQSLELSFLSESLQEILGCSLRTFSIDWFFRRIHPDDLEYFLSCEKIARYFLFEFIKKSEIIFYKVSYQFRVKDKNDDYKLFLHQCITISVDEKGNLSNVFCNHSDISHITCANNYKMSFIDARGVRSFYNISKISDLYNLKSSVQKLTQREVEIIKLISEGFSSKEISNLLHISYETVRTHRNNILKKTKFRSIYQTVAYCIREGII